MTSALTRLLVHGSMSGARQWCKLAERLTDCYRVIAPDPYINAERGEAVTLGAFISAEDGAFAAEWPVCVRLIYGFHYRTAGITTED